MIYKSYIIHLNHDIGRYQLIKKIKKKINGEIFLGCHGLEIINNVLVNGKNKRDNTRALKKTYVNLLNSLNKNIDFIFIFEDDIYIHKNFDFYYKKLLEYINKKEKWKLIYLGSSNPITYNDNNFIQPINKINNKIILNGSYAIAIHNSCFNELIERAENNEFIDSPWDISCLGYIQLKYVNECYITNPLLLITDVSTSNIRTHRNTIDFNNKMNWKIENYELINSIPIFIVVKDNIKRIERSLELTNCFYPLYKPILLHLGKPKITTQEYLKIKSVKGGIQNYIINSTSCMYSIIKKIANNFSHYIITNYYINWQITSDNIKGRIDDYFKKYNCDVLVIKIDTCLFCNNIKNFFIANKKVFKKDTHIDLLNGFTIVKQNVDLTNDILCKIIEFPNRILYNNLQCNSKIITCNNFFHNKTLDDIRCILELTVLKYSDYWYNIIDFNLEFNINDLNLCLENLLYSKIKEYFENNKLNYLFNNNIFYLYSEIDKNNFKIETFSIKYDNDKIIINTDYSLLWNSINYSNEEKNILKKFLNNFIKKKIICSIVCLF